jgi:hypothetical protein
MSFEQLNEAIKFLSSIEFDISNSILLNSTSRYLSLKHKWIENLLFRLLKDKINNNYIERLASSICKQFNTDLVDKLLNSISVI